jgi:subtilisin family serine protease
MRGGFRILVGASAAVLSFVAALEIQLQLTPPVAAVTSARGLPSPANEQRQPADTRLARAVIPGPALSYQYVRDKLQLPEVHALARGKNVPIAVIDSGIDADHPDFSGAEIVRYDATATENEPHAHGTGVVGAIVSRHKLLGVAPNSRVLAIRVFPTPRMDSESEASPHHILRGLDWAVRNNVRIVNMSFAGPRDPLLQLAFKAAYDKGVILIAAVGNGGPHAPALYPAADPHVIAVTATDFNDRLFSDANRGAHVAISAPGVDVLTAAPRGTYQVTTGTSVAAAHVSGVVALMLERNPALTPAAVRNILTATARPLGQPHLFGAGLVDPVRAVKLAQPRIAALTTRP